MNGTMKVPDITELNDKQLLKVIKYCGEASREILLNISHIEKSNDKEYIKDCINRIVDLFNSMLIYDSKLYNTDVKSMIRTGKGDFRRIQQKCIDIGVI